jgi:hypothetical protein
LGSILDALEEVDVIEELILEELIMIDGRVNSQEDNNKVIKIT